MSLVAFLKRQTAFTLKVFLAPIYGSELAVQKAVRERETSRAQAVVSTVTAPVSVKYTSSQLQPPKDIHIVMKQDDLLNINIKMLARNPGTVSASANSHVAAA